MIVGLTNGCWDVLHEGHRLFLAAASGHCDFLIVAVNSDASIKRLKGPERPIHPLEQRLYDIQALCSADVGAVIPFDGAVVQLIAAIKPDIIIRGHDQTTEGMQHAKLIRLQRFGTMSTTGNLNAKSRLS